MKLSREKFEQIFLLDIKLNRFKYENLLRNMFILRNSEWNDLKLMSRHPICFQMVCQKSQNKEVLKASEGNSFVHSCRIDRMAI